MKVLIPTNCPSCNSLIERVKDQLFCRNSSCNDAQIKKVESFAKKMKIRGLGIKTIEKLGLQSINDIYAINEDVAIDTIGEKLGQKLLAEIEKSKTTSLDTFLSACSIYLIGQTIAKKLLPFISKPNDISKEIMLEAGLGEKARNSLQEWFEKEFIGNLEYLPITFIEEVVETKIASKYTVCITGKIPGYTKSSLAKELESKHITTVNTVTNKINYLICNTQQNSSKEQKAKSLGIEILTLEELFKKIGE